MAENQSGIRKTMRTVDFFNIYFSKFKYIILSNLMFSIFTIIAAGYIYMTYKLVGGFSVLISAAAVIPLNVGMGGMAQVCRYIYTGKSFSLSKAFFGGIKENFLKTLLHGVVFYLLFAVCYSSVVLYYSGTKSSVIFWVPLVITGLISLLMLFASYYLNIMTVTMDIKLKDLYRNCALFSFGELKNNILVTIALLILSAVIFALSVIVFNPIYTAVMIGLFSLLIVPSTLQYIITFYVYDGMIDILDASRKRDTDNEKKKTRTVIEKNEAEEISNALSGSDDEYIFHNGRMSKRSEVEKQLNNDMLEDE